MTMVGNESGIIESFIRYNANFIDEMIFVSTCCIDNTLVIIRKLMNEGYPITLIEEPYIIYDQKLLDYRYMKKIAEKSDADWFMNLDADEFLTGSDNPRKILGELPIDRVYEVEWKNYVMTREDNLNESFIPKRLAYFKKQSAKNRTTKVIVPMGMAKDNIVMSTGHHGVSGENIRMEKLDTIQFAHYPVISYEQYLSKLYGNRIKFITWINRGNGEGCHQNKQIAELESGVDIYKVANGYGLENGIENELNYAPLDLSYCDAEKLKIRYTDLAKVDYIKNIIYTGQLMALKAYLLEVEAKFDKTLKNILIFGVGASSVTLFNGLPENMVNIKAYIDNDAAKEFTMYNHRLVIRPDWIRFFTFDKIIISNTKYYTAMKEQLLELGIDKEKIGTVRYLFELLEAGKEVVGDRK